MVFPNLGLRGIFRVGGSFRSALSSIWSWGQFEPIEPIVWSRSGVEPPTGKLHPRESIGMEVKNREFNLENARGGFSRIWGREGYLAGVDRSGRGFNPRPAQGGGSSPGAIKIG